MEQISWAATSVEFFPLEVQFYLDSVMASFVLTFHIAGLYQAMLESATVCLL